MFYLFSACVDSEDKQVQLITTLDNSEVDLLTLDYVKVRVIHCDRPVTHYLVYSTIKNCNYKQIVGFQIMMNDFVMENFKFFLG